MGVVFLFVVLNSSRTGPHGPKVVPALWAPFWHRAGLSWSSPVHSNSIIIGSRCLLGGLCHAKQISCTPGSLRLCTEGRIVY